MACGSGKTLIGIRARERFAARKTLVVVPSLPLMKQVITAWQRHSKVPFRRIAVCSDQSVDDREDVVQGHPGELGVRVTTDPQAIAAFLGGEGDSVVFSTYHSLERIAAAAGQGDPFDLLVADEAHWAAGLTDSPYAVVLDNHRLPTKKRLFLTATPRIYSEDQRLEARSQNRELASMDDSRWFGPVAHRLSFGQAIELQLLADYRVVVCVVTDPEQLDLVRRRGLVTAGDSHVTDAASLAAQVVVLRAMRRFGLHRILTFHSRVTRAANFASRLPTVAQWMPDQSAPIGVLNATHVHGGMPTLRRDAALKRLEQIQASESAVVSNVRCLAEGVDVPGIDAVVIADPKRSRPEIIQAIGRALRTNGETGKVATIIVPVFIPQGEGSTAALNSSTFKPVWEVLLALRDQDERLADEVDALRFDLGFANRLDTSFERLVVDVPSEVGGEFVAALNAKLVREVGLTPQTQIRTGKVAPTPRADDLQPAVRRVDRGLDPVGLEALRRFVEKTGHSRVPPEHHEEGLGLSEWLEGTLSAIERNFHGNPSRYFKLDQASTFYKSMRWLDLDADEYPSLFAELDPLNSLAQFWDAVAEGRFPAELQTSRSISTDDFPQGETWESSSSDDAYSAKWDTVDGYVKYEGEWSYWKHGYGYLLEQSRPDSPQEKFDAAVVALETLREAESQSQEISGDLRAVFRLGVVEGIYEVGREGCLIDVVEQRLRSSHRVASYVKGWDFGKTKRQESAWKPSNQRHW
jgi:superfamily II DNA or RNA helicase